MIPGMPSSRQRAGHRRSLYLIALGLAAALACLLVPAAELGRDIAPGEAAANGAPPEPALRPNAPTEPTLGRRVSGPGG
jgi:hypothetical protein